MTRDSREHTITADGPRARDLPAPEREMSATTTKTAGSATATGQRAQAGTGAPAAAARGTAGAQRPDRQRMLRAVAGIAAATIGAGVLAESQSGPVAASDDQAVSLGQVNTAEHRTTVLYDGAGGFRWVVLAGSDSTYDGSSALYLAAVGGFAGAGATAGKGGVATGVYGQSDNSQSFGVVGYNGGGGTGVFGDGTIGVYGRSNSGDAVYAISQTGTAVSAVSGGDAVDAMRSSTGGYAAISAVLTSTTPGDWSAAVRGVNNGTGTRGIGVYGIHNGAGQGVLGYSYHGTGVWAASGSGYGAECTGGLAPLRLVPAGTAGAPTTGTHQLVELYVDATGVLYFCTASGTPGTWKTVQLV